MFDRFLAFAVEQYVISCYNKMDFFLNVENWLGIPILSIMTGRSENVQDSDC